ncbi:MAG TPA: 5-(carboxyamino)imidazole ribonucleotide synthase [Candidatus Thermoplasmatota archaeon]|nr:5-(carboxyamino)imidazole ribonucleotide synthase [Candidatus Thermoplasmatota archaeon]
MILPGATLGILGGGQLGQMIAMEARRLGYRVAVLDPDPQCAARPWADDFVQGAFHDADAAVRLAERADVVTLETEHIPAPVLEAVEKVRPLHPSSRVLAVVQDRLRQKEFLAKHGFPTAPFRPVDDEQGVRAALRELGAPIVLKTRRGGYDGKGQAVVKGPDEAADAWRRIGQAPAVAEAFVRFDRELSVLLARAHDGEVRIYPLAENVHRRGILHTTVAPARAQASLVQEGYALGQAIAQALDLRGMLAVETFEAQGRLVVNELAPRTHNSGHTTFGASSVSQFEQHARAVLGLPLREPTTLSPAVMLNLLGDLWEGGAPDWRPVLAEPRARLHLYGKKDARPGRKMGHVLVLHADPAQALSIAQRLHETLSKGADPR